MQKLKIKAKNLGFSLIEVVVFVAILGIFFVTAASVVSIALQNSKVSEHKIIATRYAEELMESLRADKEDDFNAFLDTYTGAGSANGTSRVYCFNNSDMSPGPIGGCGSSYSFGNPAIYAREATITKNNQAQASVAVIVRWQEAGNTFTVPLNAVFTVTE